MVYHLAIYFKSSWSGLNVVHYVTVRAILSLLSTLSFSFLFGNRFLHASKKFFRSKSREWTPDHHKQKDNLPTMGGIFILGLVIGNALLWCDLSDLHVWIFLLGLVGFGAIGGWDDWCKIRYQNGMRAKTKFSLQLFVSFLVTLLWVYYTQVPTTIVFPFFKNVMPNIGLFFIPWSMFVLVAMSNAVNLTDGLDGLAITSLMPNFATFGLICYLAGHAGLAAYLQIPFTHTAELTIIGAILVGASLGFLWYNTYPAQIFMGDVGSLALGAALAFMALMAKQELLLPIAGGLFVLETISVILQVLSYKFYGKRIFKMAPIHHHFELLGWQESKITVRFGIISFVLCLLALITLKLR